MMMISTYRAALSKYACRNSAPQFGGQSLSGFLKPEAPAQTNPHAAMEQRLDKLSKEVTHLQEGQQFFFELLPEVDEQFDTLLKNQTSMLGAMTKLQANQARMMEQLTAIAAANSASPSMLSSQRKLDRNA
jgi:hypothetical protein